MNATIISYSHTGNNETLATRLAAALEAEHVRVAEERRRTMDTIVMDILFNRTPSVDFSAESIAQHDLMLFVGPVWMGHVATPLRACFKQLSVATPLPCAPHVNVTRRSYEHEHER